jgi:hypothetical protein
MEPPNWKVIEHLENKWFVKANSWGDYFSSKKTVALS